MTIECVQKIPGWTGKAFEKDVPRQINGKLCGVPSFVNATKATLKIDKKGNATLVCKR